MEWLTRARLRVASAICANLAVVWIVALLASPDTLALLWDIALVIVFTGLAVKAESLIEEL